MGADPPQIKTTTAEHKKKLDKYTKRLQTSAFTGSTEFQNLSLMVTNCAQMLAQVETWISAENYAQAEEENWRLSVDLEAIGQMMGVVKPKGLFGL